MSILIAAIFFGLGFAYLATQNTMGVTLHAGNFIFPAIPLYIVVLGSLLVGLFIAWIISSITWVSSMMTIRGKNSMIKHSEVTVNKLQRRVRELELENSKLRGEVVHDRHETHVDEVPRRNFFDRFRPSPRNAVS